MPSVGHDPDELARAESLFDRRKNASHITPATILREQTLDSPRHHGRMSTRGWTAQR